MRRGAISDGRSERKTEIAAAIEAQGIATELARRIAFQLVLKIDIEELANRAVWDAIGQFLRLEVAQLRTRVGLTERQIIAVLPKLSAQQVVDFFEELQATDRRIARTILNAALKSAEPLSAGRRYLAGYRGVAEHLNAIDPAVARTLANATFTAASPRGKALEHIQRFADLMRKTPDDQILTTLASSGMEAHIARTLASSRRLRKHLYC
jgi:hypothetical protein